MHNVSFQFFFSDKFSDNSFLGFLGNEQLRSAVAENPAAERHVQEGVLLQERNGQGHVKGEGNGSGPKAPFVEVDTENPRGNRFQIFSQIFFMIKTFFIQLFRGKLARASTPSPHPPVPVGSAAAAVTADPPSNDEGEDDDEDSGNDSSEDSRSSQVRLLSDNFSDFYSVFLPRSTGRSPTPPFLPTATTRTTFSRTSRPKNSAARKRAETISSPRGRRTM